MDAKYIEKAKKVAKKDGKLPVKALKYLKKIDKLQDYDDYVKKYIKLPLIEWCIQVVLIRTILFFAVICCLVPVGSILNHPHKPLLLALGISLSWYLLVELKQDLWRK